MLKYSIISEKRRLSGGFTAARLRRLDKKEVFATGITC